MPAKQLDSQLPCTLFKGLIVNPSQLNVNPNAATLCSNVEKDTNGQLTTRKGIRTVFHKERVRAQHNMFPVTYTYHDTDTGGTKEELLVLEISLNSGSGILEARLYRVIEQTLTITYVGSSTGRIQLYPEYVDSSVGYQTQWRLILRDQTGVVLNTSVVTSEDASITTGRLSDIVGDIHALASFNCSPSVLSSSAGESPIDVFGPWIDQSLTNGQTLTKTYYDLELVNQGDLPPLNPNDANFTLPSFQDYSNVLDIAYGTYVHKYDGHRFYTMGLPQALISSISDSSGGSTFAAGEVYIYKLVFARTDNRGNIIEGEDSDDTLTVATHTMSGTRDIDITIKVIDTLGTNYGPSLYSDLAANPFDARSAKINGTQSIINTVTVDSGHDIIVGDTVYFKDTSVPEWTSRLVTAVTATTITIDGASFSVTDDSVISNNVRIQIWRTKNSGVDFYLVDEIPNFSQAVSGLYTFTDTVSDGNIGEPFIEQLRKNTAPPKASHVGSHQGLRTLTGDPRFPNRVYWSLPDASEGFPAESNLTDLKSGGLGAITGHGSVDDNALAIFKETGHALLEGTLDDLNFAVKDRSSTGIGCSSHRTLQNIGEADSLVGLSTKGPFIFNGSSPSLVIGENIIPFFDQKRQQDPQVNGTVYPSDYTTTYFEDSNEVGLARVFRRAVAINDDIRSRYHLYIPCEIGNPGTFKAPFFPSSKWFVFDYDSSHLQWHENTFYNRYRTLSSAYDSQNVSPSGGFTIYQSRLWYGMNVKRENSPSYDIRAVLGYFKNDDTIYDYSDDSYPVYLDLHYIPFTRTPGSGSAFFKPLWVTIYKFLTLEVADPAVTVQAADFGSPFNLLINIVKDFKQYAGNVASTIAERFFDPTNAKTSMRVKCVTTKARAIQIQINNSTADPADFENPAFDNVEFVYSVPYDKQTKEPKAKVG